jgi:hypothetical protein
MTVSMPMPATLVPARTVCASNTCVDLVSVPNAAVTVPTPAAFSAASPALPV